MLTWTDLAILSISFAIIYKLLFPKKQPVVRLTPKELRNVLEIQTRRREFSALAWIQAGEALPQVGRSRLGGVR